MSPITRTILFSLLLLGFLSPVFAQHPIGYTGLKSTSQTGNVVFEALDRKILREKIPSFFIEAPCAMTFEILVEPNGSVKYVRSGRFQSGQREMRLACISAFYGYQFSKMPASEGEKWLKAVVTVSEE